MPTLKYSPIAALLFVAISLFPLSLNAQSFSKKTDSLKQAIKTSKTDSDKINALIGLADYHNCDDTLNDLRYANEALQLAKKINWQKGIINADNTLGILYSSCFKKDSIAVKYFQEAVALAKNTHDLLNEGFALNGLAQLYQSQAQYNLALQYYREELALKPGLYYEPTILGNMGIVYSTIGDYTKALACYDSSLKITDEIIRTSKNATRNDTLERAGLLVTIGGIYVSMSQYDKALKNFNNALKVSEQTKNKILELWALMGIANACHDKKDRIKAIEYYNRALEDCKILNSTNGETTVLIQLANVYLEKEEVNKAMEYAQKASKLAEEHSFIDLMPTVYIALGKIYTAQKKYSDAVVCLQKAVSICGKSCSLLGEKDAWEALSNTYDRMDKPALAYDAYKHFIAIRDSVYNISKANELTRMDLQAVYSRDSLKHADTYSLNIQNQRVYIYSGFGAFVLVLLLTFFIYRNYSQQKKANKIISRAHESIKKEKQLSENLLLNILPEEVAKELKKQGNVQAKLFDHVTVLFTDFVNFTEAAERDTPQELVAELHTCFMAFDAIVSKYNIEKIKTVGDAYIAVSGLPQPHPNHASEIIKAAIEIRDYMLARGKELGDGTFEMRIGINTGNVVAGIVGVKKFAYDIWGDTVNIAARMEQYSEPGKINISQSTYELVKDKFAFTDRGEIDAKHKGKMKMYFVEK